jgi:hypothetical protein
MGSRYFNNLALKDVNGSKGQIVYVGRKKHALS